MFRCQNMSVSSLTSTLARKLKRENLLTANHFRWKLHKNYITKRSHHHWANLPNPLIAPSCYIRFRCAFSASLWRGASGYQGYCPSRDCRCSGFKRKQDWWLFFSFSIFIFIIIVQEIINFKFFLSALRGLFYSSPWIRDLHTCPEVWIHHHHRRLLD